MRTNSFLEVRCDAYIFSEESVTASRDSKCFSSKLQFSFQEIWYKNVGTVHLKNLLCDTQMLEGLYDTQWAELRDAHGSADKVPTLLRDLVSLPSEPQLLAFHELADRINHQASCYQATLPAIKYLLQILPHRKFRHKERMLSLLQTIAIGLDSDELHCQTMMSTRFDKPEYQEVAKGVPQFLNFLKHRDRGTRIQAAYNLAWFPKSHRSTLPRLRELMQTTKNTEEFASALLSVGVLEFQSSVKRPNRKFVRSLLDDSREVVQYAAALYLYWHDRTDIVMDLIQKLSEDGEYDCYIGSKSFRFAGYAWNQYAAALIELQRESVA